jgi:hypothetical protein
MRRIAVLVLSLALAAPVRGEAVALEKPIYCEVFLRDATPKTGKVSGNLVSYDDEQFKVQNGAKEQTLAWTQITPSSAFILRQRLIDKSVARDWLALGEFGWKLGAQEQARAALKSAVRLDASLKAEADKITATPSGELMRADTPKADKEKDPAKPEAGDEKPAVDGGDPTIAQPGRKKGEKVDRVKFIVATPEEHTAAIAAAKEQAAKAEEQMKVKFQTFETDHFIIFTDWDARESNFLKSNLEKAYTVVAKQFDISPKENVFIGKLPVYMWAKYTSFEKYAAQMDDFPVSNTTLGYYHGNARGIGHMSMWKPTSNVTGTSSLKEAETLWGYVLVHEFTHAFIARYRSNERIPRWMNEGIAEVIAMSQVPMTGHYMMARMMANSKVDVKSVFDDDRIPSGNFYPVMQTMVEVLVNKDRKTFIKMIDAIKDGTEPEEALKQFYHIDYDGLADAWREYAKRLNKN